MQQNQSSILTINGGSSSIKFAVYQYEETLSLLWHGAIENIGADNTTFSFKKGTSEQNNTSSIEAKEYTAASDFLIHWLEKQIDFTVVKAIGHRVVHGMQHTEPQMITPSLLEELKSFRVFDPEHLPGEIKLMEAFQQQHPNIPQLACFDTSFHTSMPTVAKLLSIPRKYKAKGIQRYGFHGLSYAYLLQEVERIAGADRAKGKIIMAHLGNGASVAAIKEGKSIDTSMGFTPASGLVMGTRTGDLDPGIASYLMEVDKLSVQAFTQVVNHQSGLLGVSETSANMQVLLKTQAGDSRAAEAIELFCYQTKKWIGSFAAALGGVDTLVFSGGIGENAAEVRERICEGLQFLGIVINSEANKKNEVDIASSKGTVAVYVIKTDEQLMIARLVWQVVNARGH